LSLFFFVIYKYKLYNVFIPNIKLVFLILKENFSIFINVILYQYVTLNFFLLGFYVSDEYLGYFGGAFKIIMPIIMITWLPFNQSIYPIMNRAFKDDFNLGTIYFKKMLKPIILFNCPLTLIIYFSSSFLIKLILGDEFETSIKILKIFSLLPLLVTLTNYFTIQGLYVMKLEKISLYIGLFSGTVCLFLNLIFTSKYGIESSAYIWVFTQLTAVLVTAYILNKKGLKILERNKKS
jgi:PST family polysaccharide transporter